MKIVPHFEKNLCYIILRGQSHDWEVEVHVLTGITMARDFSDSRGEGATFLEQEGKVPNHAQMRGVLRMSIIYWTGRPALLIWAIVARQVCMNGRECITHSFLNETIAAYSPSSRFSRTFVKRSLILIVSYSTCFSSYISYLRNPP